MRQKAPVVPQHVAIIMDGNGRWARKRFLPRVFGHRAGADSARAAMLHAAARGIGYLTLYAFSTENRQRPAFEVGKLMNLLRNYLHKETEFLCANNFKAVFLGNLAELGQDIVEAAATMRRATQHNTGMSVALAVNYGGRQELAQAAQRAFGTAPTDTQASAVSRLERCLDTAGLPDPDLLIRSGGEKRLSNFLLWQTAYSELYFCDTLWPDFGPADFDAALHDYAGRKRRFGLLDESVNQPLIITELG